MSVINNSLYYNADHTAAAVLISPGFGAGWSTWEGSELAWRREIVEFFLAHKDNEQWMNTVDRYNCDAWEQSMANREAEEFFKSIGYDECPYLGGFNQIKLVWVPLGAAWRIKEYDGNETLIFLNNENYTTLF